MQLLEGQRWGTKGGIDTLPANGNLTRIVAVELYLRRDSSLNEISHQHQLAVKIHFM